MSVQRRQLTFRNYAQVRTELDGLLQNGYDRAGQWDLAQVSDHLTYFIDGSLDGATFKVPWLVRVLIGRLVIKRILSQGKIKPGAPTPQKPLPPAGADSGVAVDRLKHALDRLENHQGKMQDSPFFGHLTPEQWRQLHLIHCAHHLGYLVPKFS